LFWSQIAPARSRRRSFRSEEMNAIYLPSAALCGLVLFTCILPARAAQSAIDPAKSSMTVRVYKTGIFSAFGHNHVIAAPISGGAVDREARRVELKVNATALRVRDAGTSKKDIDAIQKTMLGPDVLDAERHQEIAFQSTSAQGSGGSWTVRGNLTLLGQTRPVSVQVRE